MKFCLRITLLVISIWFCATDMSAAQPTGQAPAAVDYSQPGTWLCLPGRKDACSANIDATVIKPDGTLTIEPWHGDPDAPIDCFYLYPTISKDKLPNSDLMTHPDEEDLVVREQLERFGSLCRLYAPIYRQVTVGALAGLTPPGDPNLAYSDVVAAWRHYLTTWNSGRGFVLIGHSQGSAMLRRLIKEEIDGKAVQGQLVSAILPGTTIAVPDGKDVGGDFKSIPICRSPDQIGCVISYASFRKSSPPPADSRFGRFAHSPGPGLMAVCANPAALAGGSGALKPYLATDHRNIVFFPTAPLPKPWVRPSENGIRTPYVTLPGLVTGECVQDEHGSYLAISFNHAADDPRIDDIQGDIYVNWKVAEDWGLHLVDINIAIGNLIEIVGQQRSVYLKR